MSDAAPNGVAVSPADPDALRRSEERYRALVEASAGTVWSWSPGGGPSAFKHVEQWWENLTGQSPADQTRTATGWLSAVHPDDQQAILDAWQHAIASGTPYDMEYRVRTRDGTVRHLHGRGVPIRGPGGEVQEWVGTLTDVTEARQAVAERERLYREVESERQKLVEVFHHAPSFMCVLRGPDHVFERVNERYLELIGRGRADLIGRPVRAAVPEAEGQGFFEILDRVYATGEPFVGTGVPITLRRGGVLEVLHLDFVYQPLHEPDGAVTGIIVQGIDRTERKRAKDERARAVAESERQWRMFETALSNSADYIYLIGTDGRFAYANKALLDLWKVDASRVAGKSFSDLGYAPALADRLDQQVRDVVRSRGPLRDEAAVTTDSGPRTYEYIFVPVIGADGEVEAVAGSTRDITERKAAETALRLSEERYRLAASATDDAIWDIDIEAGIVHWSERYTRAFGRPPETADSWQWWIDRIWPDDRERTSAGLRAAVAGTDTHWACAYRFLRADGAWVEIEDRAIISRDGSGAAKRVVGAMRDVTARKELEAEFRQSQKMEAFGQLAGGIAHDFNNLLTVINGYSALILKEMPADHPDADAMAEIRAAGKRAEDLTRQLLAFGRRQVLQPKELDLNGLIANLLKFLGRLLGEDVRLVTDLSPSLGRVMADPGQLEQVLMNLCVNARDAMPTGGWLTIGTDDDVQPGDGRPHPGAPAGRYVRVTVSDTGCGMTDEVRARIFEPFFTTKPVGEGTGLGLSTVFGIVEQSGGHITVRSQVGLGTTFEVYLPATAPASATPHVVEAPRPVPGGRETVLLVEDEHAVRKLTAMLLREAGYEVLEAEGAVEAARVYAAAAGAVQLLVTDVVMPHESGRELAEQFARASPGLRVLFMSGYTDDRVMRHGIQSSEVAFIQKPFEPAAFLHKVRELLDQAAV